jgi:hypothetical protein
MKVIIAGGRNFTDYLLLLEGVVESGFDITSVVSGCAKGADELGELFARDMDLQIHRFPANWDKYGRAAGPIRNGEMANVGEALLAFWDGKSSGTKNMIEQATRKGIPIYVKQYNTV